MSTRVSKSPKSKGNAGRRSSNTSSSSADNARHSTSSSKKKVSSNKKKASKRDRSDSSHSDEEPTVDGAATTDASEADVTTPTASSSDEGPAVESMSLNTPKQSPTKKQKTRRGKPTEMPTSARVLFGPSATEQAAPRRRLQKNRLVDSEDEAGDDVDGEDAGAEGAAEDDAGAEEPAPIHEISDDEKGDSPDGTPDDDEEQQSGNDSDAHSEPRRKTAAKLPQTPTKSFKTAAAALTAAVSKINAGNASSAAASPIKKWIAPIGGSTFNSSTSGRVSTTAKKYDVKVLAVGDISSAINNASRVARKTVVAVNLQTGDLMVLMGFAEDATKYMANLLEGDSYTLELETKAQTVGKALCLADHTHYYKIASGTKIRRYIANESDESKAPELDDLDSICSSIQATVSNAPGDWVNVKGIVMKVTTQQMRSGTGLKIILADEQGYVNVMFFEPKASIVLGASLVLIGAKVWTNTRSSAQELSVYNSTLVMTNQLVCSAALVKMCVMQDYTKIVNASAVPSEEPRTMRSMKEEAALLSNDSDHISGTVLLHLDALRPVNGGNISYNGCIQCKRKIKQLDETDEDGNFYYDHDVDRGDSHKALTYNSHFFFSGRFREEDDEAFHLAQVDDTLGEGIFGVTAEVMSQMDVDEQAAVMKRASSVFKYNIQMVRAGAISRMVMV